LNFWFQEISKAWSKENPLGLNETLLAMKAYAPYHQLYAVSMCFAISNIHDEERIRKMREQRRKMQPQAASAASDENKWEEEWCYV
jgi:hypothetical protein